MGTTRDALLANEGMTLGFVLAIEGYPWLLTNTSNTAAVVRAWQGTLWSQALTGLQVSGQFEQHFKPFSNDLDVPTFSFRVLPDEDDTFGKAVFRAKPDAITRITSPFSASHSSFDIDVQSSGNFSVGPVYVGNTAYNVSAIPGSGTALTVEANGAGYYAPLGTNVGSANRFPGQADLPAADTSGSARVTQPPYISDSRRTFVGATVGLWVHRIVEGVWDTKAQAELLFAGTIEEVTEAGDGATVLSCIGLQAQIEDAVLLRDQFTATPKEGMYFDAGMKFDLTLGIVTNTGGSAPSSAASQLVCTTGASGSAQFEPGTYTAPELCALIGYWLNSDGTLGSHQWSCGVVNDESGIRTELQCVGATSTSNYKIRLKANDARMLTFLGFENAEGDDGYYKKLSDYERETVTLKSELPPMRLPPIGQRFAETMAGYGTFELDNIDGTFADLTAYLPSRSKEWVGSGEVWSFFSYGDRFLFLAEKVSDAELSSIRAGSKSVGIPYPDVTDIFDNAIRMGEELPTIKQVAILSGNFGDLLTKFMASVDGSGSNHATYDVFPWGVGLPWEVLGDGWVDSVTELEEKTDQGYMVVIEKPTKFWEVIKSDLVMRSSFFTWKDGTIQQGTMTTPNASTADWTLTEDNKAVEAGSDPRTATSHTSEYLVNNIKVQYDRDPLSEKYTKRREVYDPASIEAYGISKPITIKARNSYNPWDGTGVAVETLVDNITSRFLPPFARPVRRWRRSIAHTLFLAAPGDTVNVTDNWVRNPDTGSRGIAARAATVLGISWSLGVSEGSHTYNGTIDLLFSEEDRLFPMAPAAYHRDYTGGSFTNGWDSSNGRLAVQDNAFSLSGEATDASRFADSDAVRVIEVDPADPASADSFTDSLSAVDSSGTPNYLELTTGFGAGGNPSFSSSKTYIVVPDSYTSCQASQLTGAFMADETDGLIQDTISPNLYGDDKATGFGAVDLTELPERHAAEWYGDGAPVHPHLLRAGARMYNNLTNYGCVNDLPMLLRPYVVAKAPAGTWQVVYCFPFYIGRGLFFTGKRRVLSVAPQFRSTSGASVSVRVTSSSYPVRGTGWDDPTFRGAKQSVTFSTSSTTSWTIATAQDLDIVRGETWQDITWLTVEMQGNTEICGVPRIFMSEAGN